MLKQGIQSASKTVLYGWGQSLALPLTQGSMDRVFHVPRLLKQEPDYALPVSFSLAKDNN